MAITNFDTREIFCKIFYLGPKGGGKTENLRSLIRVLHKDCVSKMMRLSEPSKMKGYFDFLPISLGQVNDFQIRLHLYSMPITSCLETSMELLRRGMDGLIYVADSQVTKVAENCESFELLHKTLREEGNDLWQLPKVFQYNKQDQTGLVPMQILSEALNPQKAPEVKASAVKDEGTFEALLSITKQVLHNLKPLAQA